MPAPCGAGVADRSAGCDRACGDRVRRHPLSRRRASRSPALSMMSRISNTRSTNAGSRCISFGGRSGGGTSISRRIVPGRRREHVDAIAEVDRLLDRMGDEEHRRLRFPPQVDEQLLHVQPRRRIERAERLVHQDDARRQDQRPRDRHALAHAAGQLARILRRVALDVEPDLARSTRAPARAARAPARRGTRGRTRRCPRPSGCRTTCSPETPCCDRSPGASTGLPPTSTVPSVAG